MNQKILLVTGGSSDIGAALIRRMAGQYDKIITHYRRSTSIVDELRTELGNQIVPLKADFSSYDETNRFIESVVQQGLTPNHFVHLSSDPFDTAKFGKGHWSAFENEINISFRSAVMCCQALAPRMAKARYGKIVIMLSACVVWEPHKPYSAAYTCTKHALLGLVKALSAEYAGKGITVNGVSPAMIDTKFLRCSDHVKELNAASSPIGRLLTVDDVVPAIEFLLSPGADAITGQNIAVTAGN